MKINGIRRVDQLYNTTGVSKPSAKKKAGEISNERLAKVEELKQKINAGEYKIDPEKIAAKITSYYQR
ncbi:flagellar biosynthesis anti-sigma factor FlgM [Fictibacillus fluitans]|uniref:Negative regulator of flagellin synthesis n=1 Tax=Fictibacillus fluitans TaxID=3058422 RepID=A0ABT8HST1_9BACL|nr:flagellar biosynthesis anti-sigma factor FlgM [Fictibacillus sp. NE201]MDN4523828.1 flagellar biosynthesis anti-sigma factor FlgM [Fictibacillus sp. NE201]